MRRLLRAIQAGVDAFLVAALDAPDETDYSPVTEAERRALDITPNRLPYPDPYTERLARYVEAETRHE